MKKYTQDKQPDGGQRVVKSYMVLPDLNEAMRQYALATHRTVASCVEEAFTDYLQKNIANIDGTP